MEHIIGHHGFKKKKKKPIIHFSTEAKNYIAFEYINRLSSISTTINTIGYKTDKSFRTSETHGTDSCCQCICAHRNQEVLRQGL